MAAAAWSIVMAIFVSSPSDARPNQFASKTRILHLRVCGAGTHMFVAASPNFVIAGLDPAIHSTGLSTRGEVTAWMPGSSPGMTTWGEGGQNGRGSSARGRSQGDAPAQPAPL